MKKPNTFIIGAPKCGTTSLANWLAEHPAGFLPEDKEPHFFSHYRSRINTWKDYEALYRQATSEHKSVIDATTAYNERAEVIERILDYNPKARFIMMLRNPAEIAFSLHSEFVKRGLQSVQGFDEAWRRQEEIAANPDWYHGAWDTKKLLYRERCMLGKHLRDVQSLVPPDALLVLFLEDMKADSGTVYREVLEFLDLHDDGRETFAVHNAAYVMRNPILWKRIARLRSKLPLRGFGFLKQLKKRAKIEGKQLPEPSEATKQHLRETFEEDIKLLSMLTNRDLDHWLK